MDRHIPVFRYQQPPEQGGILTAFRNWLHTLKIILFLILCMVFVFAMGAGWAINYFDLTGHHKPVKSHIKYRIKKR